VSGRLHVKIFGWHENAAVKGDDFEMNLFRHSYSDTVTAP